MSWPIPNIITSLIKTLDVELFGNDMSQAYAHLGKTTKEQWDLMPVKQRGVFWDEEGRLFVVERKSCPLSGLKVQVVREIVG